MWEDILLLLTHLSCFSDHWDKIPNRNNLKREDLFELEVSEGF